MDKTQLVYRDPNDLQLHRLLKQIPEPDKKSLEWNAFVDSVRAAGVEQPLIITSDNLVMAGSRRWYAARQVVLDEVPCVIRPEHEAAAVIVDGLLHTRHMTRGAAIYLALTMLPDWMKSANSRRLANLQNGGKTNEKPLILSKESVLSFETVQDLCIRWGISVETYKRARLVLEIFTAKPALKKEWEPRLLSGEKNLWNVLSAIGGAGADQTNRERGVLDAQLELFGESFSNFKKGAQSWKKFSQAQREKIITEWRETAEAMPEDMREAMVEALMEVAR